MLCHKVQRYHDVVIRSLIIDLRLLLIILVFLPRYCYLFTMPSGQVLMSPAKFHVVVFLILADYGSHSNFLFCLLCLRMPIKHNVNRKGSRSFRSIA